MENIVVEDGWILSILEPDELSPDGFRGACETAPDAFELHVYRDGKRICGSEVFRDVLGAGTMVAGCRVYIAREKLEERRRERREQPVAGKGAL